MNKKRQWKKEWLIIGIILGIFILSQTINEEKISIIGRTVLDTWSTVSLNASISIDNSPLDIIIDSPENRTYVDILREISIRSGESRSSRLVPIKSGLRSNNNKSA